MRSTVLAVVALAVTATLAAPALRAQVGSTTDIITGKITGPPPGKQPLVGATVTVTSIDTHISRSRQTNSDGHYTVVFPDGGGQYRLEVHSVGFEQATIILSRQADEDRLVANVQMSTAVATLRTVNVRARLPGGRDAANAGGTGVNLSPSLIEKLPVDGSDLATLATLAPGVVGLSATDTTATAFSVAGQRQSLNSTTVDGVTFGGSSVPTEATRSIRVVTNSYDVSRGQFTGGQIATTTRGGTNDLAGSFAFTIRNQNATWGAAGPPAFGQLRNQIQLSGGLGGPIIKDKLFSFTAIQFQHRYDDLVSLLNADPSTLSALGISRDTAQQFINKVKALGLPVTSGSVPSERGVTSVVAFQRFDYLLTDDETLTLRLDYRATAQDGTRVSAFSLPSSGTATASAGGGALLALTSHIGDATINDFRAYVTHSQTSLEPYLKIPAGRVTVVPQGPDSDETEPLGYGVSSLSFGGTAATPMSTFNDYVEATNEISLIPGEGAHRIKLGFLINVARFGQNIEPNQEGAYSYQSLSAFEADSPATFTRTLNQQNTEARAYNAAVYLGDAYRTGPIQLTYGARLEGSAYGGAPAYDGAIDYLFHRRTDDWPAELHASPRVGFTWFVGSGSGGTQAGSPNGGGGNNNRGGGFRNAFAIVRGGFGEFRAPVPQSLFSSLQSANGSAESVLSCVGAQVPSPNWAGFANGSAPPPSECIATTDTAGNNLGLGAKPAVTTFAPDFEAPRAWRGSLGIQKRFFDRVTFALDGTYARGERLFGVTDLNLNTTPGFRIANEGNRPVFASPGLIDPTTGAPLTGASRIYSQYGQVLSLNSNLQSDTRQLTASANGFTDHGILYSVSYTFSHVRDQSSFSGGSAVYGFSSPTTNGNPNVQPWGTSDLQRQNQFVGTMTFPINALIEITGVAQLSSGTPYSPIVNGDINGDGSSRNDRAFVFDPNNPSTDPAVASAMRTLLTEGPGRIRDCLNSQIGDVAARNSCFGPWTTSLNWQINVRPNNWGLDRRLTISLQVVNTLTGLDLLFHGPNHLEGWGQPAAPDATLLSVVGFNPTSEEYKYVVNTHFGRASATQAYGQPFALVLTARLNVGPGDAANQLRGFFGGGGREGGGGGGPGGPGGGPGGPGGAGAGAPSTGEQRQDLADAITDRFAARLRNPAAQILALKDSILLSAAQDSSLDSVSKIFQARADSVTGVIRTQLKNLGANLDFTTMGGIIRRQASAVRAIAKDAIDASKRILTDAQWPMVPDDIRNFDTNGGGRGRGGPPGP
jgi:hypothetical protein